MKEQKQKKYVYFFGAGQTEGNANMRELLGGKGANLAEMAGLGLPVPQGFTISTEACTRYYDDGKVIGDDIMQQVMEYVGKLEKSADKTFALNLPKGCYLIKVGKIVRKISVQ